MIVYQLRCRNQHEFEAWFPNSDAGTKQIRDKKVTCPVCASTTVEKAIMAPNISTRSSAGEKAIPLENSTGAKNAVQDQGQSGHQRHIVANDRLGDEKRATEVAMKVLEAVSDFKRHVEANSEYVGADFPEVARQMHYGETEQRAVYGEASLDEVKSLDEDGIDVIPLGPATGREH